MKKLLYLFLVFGLFACSNESADDDNPDNNISELIGIYEIIWIEEESNTADCYTVEFKTDSTLEEIFDDDGDDICGNEEINIVRSYDIFVQGDLVIRGSIGTGTDGLISAFVNGVEVDVSAVSDDWYEINFEYDINSEILTLDAYLEANDLIVYTFQKL